MDVRVDSEKENKLLDRKELSVRVAYKGATPPRVQVREAVGRKLGVNPELVAIRKITNEYGKSEVHAEVHVYGSVELYKKHEPTYIRVRYGEKKEEKAPAADKPEEAKG